MFERFFNVIKSYEWFEIIKFKYVANLLNYEEKLKWTRNLLFKSDKFINSHTKEFIDYYNDLINGGIDKELLFPIFLALTKFYDLKYDGIYEILKYALKFIINTSLQKYYLNILIKQIKVMIFYGN